jgi:hypothetical protein
MRVNPIVLDYRHSKWLSLKDMKSRRVSKLPGMGCLFCFPLLFPPLIAAAQGTTYLSNLTEPGLDEYGVLNIWYAQAFETGTSTGGYSLDSVQLVAGAIGNPIGNFSVSIYSSLYSPPIGILSGINPSVLSTYTYATTGISLQPSTEYFIVVTDTSQDDANDYYFWNSPMLPISGGKGTADLNYNSSGNWQIPAAGFNDIFSYDGTDWFVSYTIESPFQFAVNATAVPEPEIYSLTGIGLMVIFFHRRKFFPAISTISLRH